jgi:hypothetical protein
MSESTSDALFGVDGTQSPEPLPDPPTGLGRGTWRGAELPPMYLPPVLDDSALREAIAAVLAEDPTEPMDQDRAAPPADPAEPGGPSAPQPGGSSAPSAGPESQATEQSPASAGARSSPLIPPLFPSAPSRPRKSVGLRYRPPMAAAFRKPVPPADLHRRVSRDRPGVPHSSPGNLALGAGLFVALVIAAVLVYNIIIGFLESISRLIP